MKVYCAVYGSDGVFNLVAIFSTRESAEIYVRRTTTEGSRVFAHLENFRVIEQEVFEFDIALANYHSR